MTTLETSPEANYDGHRTDRRTKRLIGARATALPKNGRQGPKNCLERGFFYRYVQLLPNKFIDKIIPIMRNVDFKGKKRGGKEKNDGN